MYNLKTCFSKFFDITKSVFKDCKNKSDNFFFYPNRPKLSDFEKIAFLVAGESIGTDRENYFLGKLMSDHKNDFTGLIDRSNFNQRRQHLYPFIEQLNKHSEVRLNESWDVYLGDYIPVPVYQIAGVKRSKILKWSFETLRTRTFLLD